MSYTFTQTGSEIQAILDRAETGGQIDQDIAAKQDALTFDDAPTSGSDNPVKSGGIYDAIQAGGATALAAFATDTVSGDIVSFPDGASNIPVKSFVGSIVPVQNLNGYDNPWPAGGGKNKLDASKFGNKVSESNGTYTFNLSGSNADLYIGSTGSHTYTAAEMALLFTLGAGTYVFSYKYGSGGDLIVRGVDANGERVNLNATEIESGTYRAYQFTLTGDTLITIVRVSSTNPSVFSEPQIEVGSSRTSFAPYSNVCPISGWTGAEIYRTGINVWDEEWELGTISSVTGANVSGTSNIRSTNYIPVKPNTTYYYRNGAAKKANLRFYGSDKSFIGAPSAAQSASTTFTTPDGCYFMRFYCVSDYGTTYSDNISFNYTATETAYHASEQAQTILLTFGSTVYAGTITALGGGQYAIQPTHAAVDMGSLEWASATSGGTVYFRAYPTDKANGLDNILCSCYQQGAATVASSPDYSIAGRAGNDQLIVIDSGKASLSADDFTTAVTGQTLVYELATLPDPIIVDASDLETLLGANNVWQSCGSVTELEYRADTALYVQKLLNGGTLQALSMASPTPTLSLNDRVGDGLTLAEAVSFPNEEPAVMHVDACPDDAETGETEAASTIEQTEETAEEE